MKDEFVAILVTCGSKKEAANIANSLLAKRLVACGNIISGIESKFWWNGKIESAQESLVIFKTRKENFKKIEKEIKRLHSYEVPEIVAVPIAGGSRKYLDWIDESIRDSGASSA